MATTPPNVGTQYLANVNALSANVGTVYGATAGSAVNFPVAPTIAGTAISQATITAPTASAGNLTNLTSSNVSIPYQNLVVQGNNYAIYRIHASATPTNMALTTFTVPLPGRTTTLGNTDAGFQFYVWSGSATAPSICPSFNVTPSGTNALITFYPNATAATAGNAPASQTPDAHTIYITVDYRQV